jgi:metal-sulfur cluster biosynthetic enzyme
MSDPKTTITMDAVNEALDKVIDPCSVAVGVPMSMRQMGLVRHVGILPGGIVEVHLRMTSPGCHMGALVFEPAIREEIGKIPSVTEVRIDFLEAIGWTENDIELGLRQQLQERRRQRSRSAKP